MRRLGLLLSVLAVLVQLVVSLIIPQPAWAADGLFPPVCGFHDAADAPAQSSDQGGVQHCPLCQLPVADHFLVPTRSVSVAFDGIVVGHGPQVPDFHVPVQRSAVPPLPSRGPPSLS